MPVQLGLSSISALALAAVRSLAGKKHSMRSTGAPADPRLEALVGLARAVVRRQTDVKERMQEALGAGLAPAEVLESLVAIAIPMLASTVAEVAPVPLDPAFQPQAWARLGG